MLSELLMLAAVAVIILAVIHILIAVCRKWKRHIAHVVARLFRRFVMNKRPPDFIIGSQADPYLYRWWIIRRNKWFNIYLHVFMRSDTDEALHDHPWANMSWLLDGNYSEIVPFDPFMWPTDMSTRIIRRWTGDVIFRPAKSPHSVKLHQWPGNHGEMPTMSLFLTGRTVREWGFWCPKGWIPWKQFVSQSENGNERGKGCGE